MEVNISRAEKMRIAHEEIKRKTGNAKFFKIEFSEEQKAWIAANFEYERLDRMAEYLGVSYSTVRRYIVSAGLKRTEVSMSRRLNAVREGAFKFWHTEGERKEASIKKMQETYKNTLNRERIREKYGMRRLTRIKLSSQSVGRMKARYNFRRWGYREVEQNTFILPEESLRHPISERNNIERYNFKFINEQ